MELQRYTYNKKNYHVDYRLQQFRYVDKNEMIEYVEFDDELGDRILCKMIKEGVADINKINL